MARMEGFRKLTRGSALCGMVSTNGCRRVDDVNELIKAIDKWLDEKLSSFQVLLLGWRGVVHHHADFEDDHATDEEGAAYPDNGQKVAENVDGCVPPGPLLL